MKEIKDAMLKALTALDTAKRLAFLQELMTLIVSSMTAVLADSVKPVKDMAAVKNVTVANKALEKIIEPSVSSYDGRLQMLGGEELPLRDILKPVTVSVITKKKDGAVVRKDPPKDITEQVVDSDGAVFGAKKGKRFFPGMNKDTLMSYGYYINGRKTSCTEFSKVILPLVKAQILALTKEGKPNYGSMLFAQYWSKADYAFPRQWVRSQPNPSIATWAKTISGQHFEVKVLSK